MAKDPAFLFYPNDFIGGTMGMTLEEKGAYLELLILQFNKGSFTIAQAKRQLGNEFENLWPHVQDKFNKDDSFFYNDRLKSEIEKRKNYSESRRKNRGKKDMIDISDTYVEDSVKTGVTAAETYVRHMENENENRIEIEKEDINRGAGGNFGIAPQMLKLFKDRFPNYPPDKNKDFAACLSMAYKIGEAAGINRNDVVGARKEEVLNHWQQIIDFVASDKWFSQRALFDLNNEWQRLIQTINNGTKLNNNSGKGATVTGEQLNNSHAKFFNF